VASRVLSAEGDGVTYRFIRGRDIPLMVAKATMKNPGIRTVGLSGSEWCTEYVSAPENTQRNVSWDVVGAKMGRVSLIAPEESDAELLRERLEDKELDTVEVATALPNLVRGLGRAGTNIEVGATLVGAVESGAATLGMAGVDLVSSGETLRCNNFVEVLPLSESWPVLVTADNAEAYV
jgi:ATP phosphoribosyltransferase